MKKSTQATGKQGELKVIGELLRKGFDIYLPLVDIGIDCIIKTGIDYREIQIKTREFAKKVLFDVKEFKPRNNFFIICYYIKEPDTFWIIPSNIFKNNAIFIKKYKRFRLVLGEEDSKMRRKLHIYRNNFFQLKEGTEEAAIELKKTVSRSGWQSLKEVYPTANAVKRKIKEAEEKSYSQGYIRVLQSLKKYWEKRK